MADQTIPETTAADEAEKVAHLFHDTYERLAPGHGCRTREVSAKHWSEVPANNRALMVATVAEVLRSLDDELGRSWSRHGVHASNAHLREA